MTFKLRDGLVVGDQTVIDSNAKVTAQDLYYDGSLPSIRPTLHYNFTRPATFPKGVWPTNPLQFARASTGTFIGPSGLIQTAAVDVPRFHYDPLTGECMGLMMERFTTNNILYSEQFTHSSWTKTNCSVSDNQVIAPDGATTAASISASATNGYIAAFNVAATNATNKGAAFTATVYAKANTTNKFKLKLFNILDSVQEYGVSVTFNLSGSGSVETVDLLEYDSVTQPYTLNQDGRIKITKLVNGWFRCDVHMVSYGGNKTIGSLNLSIVPVNVSGNTGLYIWGAGLHELRAPALSYIKTSGTAATVASDQMTLMTTAFGSYPGVTSTWYNQSEGTMAYEAMPTVVRNQGAENCWFAGYTGSSSYFFHIPSVGTQDDLIAPCLITNGYNYSSTWPGIGNEMQAYQYSKFSLAFDSTSPYYCLNGVNYPFPSYSDTASGSSFNTNTYGGLPTIKGLMFSKNANLVATSSIWKWFSYYDKKLSNTETLELTK